MSATPPQETHPLDFRTLLYPLPPDENLSCPICRSPLLDPVTTICRHTFCRDCLSGAMGVSPTCPVDRSPIGDGDIQIAPVLIGNLVGDLIVLCPNASEGCTESVQRNMVEAHWRGCGFGMVECGGCGERIRRKDWEQGGCGHKMVECGYCAEEEHEEVCPQLSAPCEHCLLEFPRDKIKQHTTTCDEAIVNCEAITVGCPWSGRRREGGEHAISCAFTYLKPVLLEHASRIATLENENKLLRRKIDIIMPTRSLEEEERTESGLDQQTIQILTEQEHVRNDVQRIFAVLQDMELKQTMLTMHMSENMRTREEVAMIGAAVNDLRSQIHGLHLLTLRRQAGTGPNNQGGSLPVRRVGDANPGGDRVKL
ncbi:hypothetical protein FPQ18DRAFT_301915 [Pyronema domesticum]|nr:hypothetical protein FPQ18DRAFT_301915 [Pyronema domesticum]